MTIVKTHYSAKPIACCMVLFALSACAGQRVPATRTTMTYPATRTVNVVDDWHGTKVGDPYRWLEDLNSPEVREWAAAQTRAAEAHLQDSVLRTWMASRWEVFAAGWETYDASTPAASPSATSAFRLETGKDGIARLISVAADGTKRTLADPATRGAGRSVTRHFQSPDASHIVYWLSANGSEWVETRIVRASDGVTLSDSLDGLRWATPVWTHDNRGFFYIRYERPRHGESVALREPTLWYHRLGTTQSDDRSIYRTARDNVEFLLGATLTPDGRYLLVTEGTEAGTDGLGQLRSRMMLLDLREASAPDLSGGLVSLSTTPDYGYRLIGQGTNGTLHVLTDKGAPRRRLVAIDPRAPSSQNWRDVIPEHDDVLHRLHLIDGRYVAHYLRDAQAVVRAYGTDGKLERTIELPPFSSLMEVRSGSTQDELLISSMTFLDPPTWRRVNLATGSTIEMSSPTPVTDRGNFEMTRVRYPSKDGTLVPMFLVHRRGLKQDGSHPVWIHGYGASHDPMLPLFSEMTHVWLELGGVLAVPNLRGGGEFGRTWYDAATRERKQNTIDDFISAAEWLIRERWTSRERLVIEGASNGGLLVAATMTQRPELFAAVIAQVPITDGLRLGLGRHTAQFGSVSNPADFPYLFAYSPLHRVKPGTCYPATLVTTSFNDERVPAWHSFKFAAALQSAQACDHRILLRADQGGGHTGTAQTWLKNEVDMLAFMTRAVGITQIPR